MRRRSIRFVACLFALLGAVLAMGCAGGPTAPSGGSIPPVVPIMETKVTFGTVIPEAPSGAVFIAGVDSVFATVNWTVRPSDAAGAPDLTVFVCLGLDRDSFLGSCHGKGLTGASGTVSISDVRLPRTAPYNRVDRTYFVHAFIVSNGFLDRYLENLDVNSTLHTPFSRLSPVLLSVASVERTIEWRF